MACVLSPIIDVRPCTVPNHNVAAIPRTTVMLPAGWRELVSVRRSRPQHDRTHAVHTRAVWRMTYFIHHRTVARRADRPTPVADDCAHS
jgi:hypothetical protein